MADPVNNRSGCWPWALHFNYITQQKQNSTLSKQSKSIGTPLPARLVPEHQETKREILQHPPFDKKSMAMMFYHHGHTIREFIRFTLHRCG